MAELIKEKNDKNWLFSDDDGSDQELKENNFIKEDIVDEFGGFADNQFENMKNGQLLFELQKTFRGDKRFQLDERFGEDLDINLLPQSFMAKIDAYKEDLIDLQQNGDIDKQEEALIQERQNMLDILQNMLPEERINTTVKKFKGRNDFQVIARFDPTSEDHSKKFIIKDQPKGTIQKPTKKEQKGEFKIVKGVDQKKKQLKIADALLGKKVLKEQTEEEYQRITKLRKKEINYSKLKEIAKENTAGFKLFG